MWMYRHRMAHCLPSEKQKATGGGISGRLERAVGPYISKRKKWRLWLDKWPTVSIN